MTTHDPRPGPRHAANNGEVPSWWSALPRRRLAVALGSTLVAVPVVVADNLPSQHATRAQAEELVAAAPESEPVDVDLAPTTTVTVELSTTTSTTAAPATTTTEPEPTSTTARPATTTTTRPPAATTTTTAAPAPAPAPQPVGNSESGQATWYRYRAGECAHKTLPRGTVVTVTNPANGASVTCVVTDRGPYGGDRIIDLDDDTFARLAPLSAGVVDVVISW